MCPTCTRREFLELGASATLSGLMLSACDWDHGWISDTPPRPAGTVRIAVILAGTPGPSDRGWNVDATQLHAPRERLAEAERSLGNSELSIGHADTPAETAALLAAVGPAAPVLAIILSSFALKTAVQPILDGDHPMVVFSLPASGHDWLFANRWREQGHPVTLMPTGNLDELERALRLLRVRPMLAASRILVFPPVKGTARARSPDEIKQRLGAEVVAVDEASFTDLINGADDDAVRAEIARWTDGATAIVEPDHEAIRKAARVSVALQDLVREQQAHGIAIGTCMGWLSKGFPCLGFARLRDAGIPAAGEGNMDSLLTMLLFQYALDRPGFQGNAVFDTSRSALWTSHCTAPLRMDGPDGSAAPYVLRSHSELGGGCVPEVRYRVGKTVTRTKFIDLDTILCSTGRIVEVPERSTHGCRTQIVTEVRDAAAMAATWSQEVGSDDAMSLLHRVVYYGDHIDTIRHLARLMRLEVVEEG